MKEDYFDSKKGKTSYINTDLKSKKKLPFIQKNSVSSVHDKSHASHLELVDGIGQNKKNSSYQKNTNPIHSTRLTPKNDTTRRKLRENDKTSSQSYDLVKRSGEFHNSSDTFDKITKKKTTISPKTSVSGKKATAINNNLKQKPKYVTVRSSQMDLNGKKMSFLDDVFSRDSLYNKIHSSFGMSSQAHPQANANNSKIFQSKFRNSMTQSVRRAPLTSHTGPSANSYSNVNYNNTGNNSLNVTGNDSNNRDHSNNRNESLNNKMNFSYNSTNSGNQNNNAGYKNSNNFRESNYNSSQDQKLRGHSHGHNIQANSQKFEEGNMRALSRNSKQSASMTNDKKKRFVRNVRQDKAKSFSNYKKISESFQPKLEASKASTTNFKIIRAYAVNTTKGIIRNYNEDRVAIILNIMKPDDKDCKYWPNCSFFGVYDGHGGSACADFLRDNLHKFVINDSNFPEKPEKALANGFSQAEKVFCHYALEEDRYEASGSCAAVLLYVDDICYVANVGDSRSILSKDNGEKFEDLSLDHKPDDSKEKIRILNAGGKIYKSPNQDVSLIYPQIFREQYVVEGPWRIMPGKLSVARSLGDICAKFPKLGGNPDVLIATPEIRKIKVDPSMDFMLVACDGVFDALTTQEMMEFMWEKIEEKVDDSVHGLGGRLINEVQSESMLRRSLDNITAILIAFENLETFVKHRLAVSKNSRMNTNSNSKVEQFDEKSKHIFRTAPDSTSLRQNGKNGQLSIKA